MSASSELEPDSSPPAPVSAVLVEDRRRFFWLALPALIEQMLVQGVDITDTYLAGTLGPAATTAVGVAAYMGWLASLVFGLIGTGTLVLVARLWGAGKQEEAERLFCRSLCLAPPLGIATCVLLNLIAPWIVGWLGLQEASAAMAVDYLRIDAIGHIGTCVLLIAAAGLRGAGDLTTPMLVLALMNGVNVVISYSCLHGIPPFPALGIRGIVTGTLTAKALGAAVMVAWLFRGRTRLRLTWQECQFDWPIFNRIFRISGPALLEGLTQFFGQFLFLRIIAQLAPQDESLAAHLIGIKVEAFSYLPAVALGIAAASLVGRLLGAQQTREATYIGHLATLAAVGYSVLTTLVFYVFANSIYQIMNENPAVGSAGVPAFQLMALYQIPNACLIVYGYALRGAGDTKFPFWCALLGTVALRVPIAWLLGVHCDWGLWGAWVGMGADNLVRAGLISWRYFHGSWQHAVRDLPHHE